MIQDTKSLKKAHRRADRIIEYAADVSLIASFHYKKKNFHLVKLLEVSNNKNYFILFHIMRNKMSLHRIINSNNIIYYILITVDIVLD